MIFRDMGPDAYAPKPKKNRTFHEKAIPDIKDLAKELADAEESTRRNLDKALSAIPPFTTRQWIAKLIRELTYRELMQIGDEIKKCKQHLLIEPETWNVAQTLDDWAHMVKEEDECISGGPMSPSERLAER